LIDKIIQILEDYLTTMKEIRDANDVIKQNMKEKGVDDIYYNYLTNVYDALNKMQRRMELIKQLKMFSRRRGGT
jgi:hypothetical protein